MSFLILFLQTSLEQRRVPHVPMCDQRHPACGSTRPRRTRQQQPDFAHHCSPLSRLIRKAGVHAKLISIRYGIYLPFTNISNALIYALVIRAMH